MSFFLAPPLARRSTAWTFAQTELTGQYTLAGRYLFDNQHYAYNPRLYLRRGFLGND